jgi:membrane protein DedA with SNARE-associated domain
LDRAERFFDRHGEISTLLGRMLPVVRHLISIPAGIARMSLPRFVLFTGLGAFLWCTILATIGYVLGQHEDVLSNVEVQHYVSRALVYLIPALVVAVIVYAWRQRRRAGPDTP